MKDPRNVYIYTSPLEKIVRYFTIDPFTSYLFFLFDETWNNAWKREKEFVAKQAVAYIPFSSWKVVSAETVFYLRPFPSRFFARDNY